MCKNGIRHTQRHERLTHADFIGQDLDFKSFGGFGVKKPFQNGVHSSLLALCVKGILDTCLVSTKIELI